MGLPSFREGLEKQRKEADESAAASTAESGSQQSSSTPSSNEFRLKGRSQHGAIKIEGLATGGAPERKG